MIEVTIIIRVDSDEDPDSVAKNIEQNLGDTLGHCPYSASIEACWGKRKDDTWWDDDG